MALELTEDKTEGHRAWRERRKPVLKGLLKRAPINFAELSAIKLAPETFL
jgi:hypothetical protein